MIDYEDIDYEDSDYDASHKNDNTNSPNYDRMGKMGKERLEEINMGELAKALNSEKVNEMDAIDGFSLKSVYTKAEADDYLKTLNETYPIKEVLGKGFDKVKNSDNIHDNLFMMSFATEAWMEEKFTKIVKESVKQGKRVAVAFDSTMKDINTIINSTDRGIENALAYNAIGFYELPPSPLDLKVLELIKKNDRKGLEKLTKENPGLLTRLLFFHDYIGKGDIQIMPKEALIKYAIDRLAK